MLDIILNNEKLDISDGAVVTFKRAQALNGIQEQYSYSNNFTLKPSAKNKRLLGINYLPNTKAKAMTAGYEVDVILNGSIFLKRQKLKVQKESADAIPVYLIFVDNLFISGAQAKPLDSVNWGVLYTPVLSEFYYRNILSAGETSRTAPISAQDASGLIVVEEVPILLRADFMVQTVISSLGYAIEGDFFEAADVKEYYFNPNLGIYKTSTGPRFDTKMSSYEFIIEALKLFNAFIVINDSNKSAGVYLWKNIDTIKRNFKDYSSKFVNFKDYTFEGGLAKNNKITYSGSPDFYNSYFENNKSIVDNSTYLASKFGAGSMRLFEDQDINDDATIDIRPDGESADPNTINIYRFAATLAPFSIYEAGIKYIENMYAATSPNIYEIYIKFHQAYTQNIKLPTIGLFTFRYDIIFLSNFKMHEVFFIKNLASYWIPLEENHSTEKKDITVKALMIEKARVDVPIVFDYNISIGFYALFIFENAGALYSAANRSPQSIFTVEACDFTKNNIFITGTNGIRTQVLSTPQNFDVTTRFILEVENCENINTRTNSDLLFTFTSIEGGTSRIGKINIAHNGRASFLSEFRSALDTEYSYGRTNVADFTRFLNYSGKITTPVNIPDTLEPNIGDVYAPGIISANAAAAAAANNFGMLDFTRAQYVKAELSIGWARYHCSNRGGTATATTKAAFNLYKNGVFLKTVYSSGATDSKKTGDTTVIEENKTASYFFNVAPGDKIAAFIVLTGSKGRAWSAEMDGDARFKNIVWKFSCDEQLT